MSGHGEEAIKKSVRTYLVVFTSLAALTVLTVAVSYLDISTGLAIMVALMIASVKASLVAMFFITTGAAAQSGFCLKHNKLAEALDGRYSEKPIAAGLDSAGKLLEIFATVDGATWTMVMTSPEGTSCVIAAGEKWLSQHRPRNEPEA